MLKAIGSRLEDMGTEFTIHSDFFQLITVFR